MPHMAGARKDPVGRGSRRRSQLSQQSEAKPSVAPGDLIDEAIIQGYRLPHNRGTNWFGNPLQN